MSKEVTIEYFLKGESLGKFEGLKPGSQHLDRVLFAINKGIGDFDRYTLDNGRAGATRTFKQNLKVFQYEFTRNGKLEFWEIDGD